ncbi:dTMP kinase [bacterium]|nr:dTMP kinase [bacterium]
MDKAGARGVFVTFEGIEGSGKTTQIARVAQRLRAAGRDVVATREPGGCPIADRIREILLDARSVDLAPRAELLLYLASRAQHVDEVIEPALAAGRIVLCDRFHDATEAYQGVARGHGAGHVRELSAMALSAPEPDLTILLDLSPETGLARARARAQTLPDAHKEDRFEREAIAFHEAVRRAYLDIAARETNRVVLIDANADADTVFARVWAPIAARLGVLA